MKRFIGLLTLSAVAFALPGCGSVGGTEPNGGGWAQDNPYKNRRFACDLICTNMAAAGGIFDFSVEFSVDAITVVEGSPRMDIGPEGTVIRATSNGATSNDTVSGKIRIFDNPNRYGMSLGSFPVPGEHGLRSISFGPPAEGSTPPTEPGQWPITFTMWGLGTYQDLSTVDLMYRVENFREIPGS